MRYHRIQSVEEGSIAQQIGIEPGDCLAAIDGKDVADVLDYRYRMASDRLSARFVSPSGQTLDARIEKDVDEDLGLVFAEPLMSKKRSCANNCIFCFIDQLPKGVRQPLRFKDDDWRLSFLFGNFVSLTNVGDRELSRITSQHISPLYISVHTTDESLRVRMVGNDKAAHINRQLRVLACGNIDFYAQIVLCPGYNDKEVLSKTLFDLAEFRPRCRGIAIVPVGLSANRQGLTPLEPVTAKDAIDAIERVEAFMQTQEEPFAQLADEFYLLAKRPIPMGASYGDYAQIEDGVGLLRRMIDEFEAALLSVKPGKNRTVSVATGEAAFDTIAALCKKAQLALGIRVIVYAVGNTFFGGGVNVTGLLTGQCLTEGLRDRPLGERLLLSKSMTRMGDDVFLDDMTVNDLSKALGTEVCVVDVDGQSFIDALSQERD